MPKHEPNPTLPRLENGPRRYWFPAKPVTDLKPGDSVVDEHTRTAGDRDWNKTGGGYEVSKLTQNGDTIIIIDKRGGEHRFDKRATVNFLRTLSPEQAATGEGELGEKLD